MGTHFDWAVGVGTQQALAWGLSVGTHSDWAEQVQQQLVVRRGDHTHWVAGNILECPGLVGDRHQDRDQQLQGYEDGGVGFLQALVGRHRSQVEVHILLQGGTLEDPGGPPGHKGGLGAFQGVGSAEEDMDWAGMSWVGRTWEGMRMGVLDEEAGSANARLHGPFKIWTTMHFPHAHLPTACDREPQASAVRWMVPVSADKLVVAVMATFEQLTFPVDP